MPHITVRKLFDTIAAGRATVGKQELETFMEKAGVDNGWLSPVASLGASAAMSKFDPAGHGSVSWDQFSKRAMALVPPNVMAGVDGPRAQQEFDKRWSEIDPQGTGAVTVPQLTNVLEAQLAAKGQSFAGTKADAGAKVLVKALDANGDGKLQKEELHGFMMDVLREAGKV
jgi:Ca2+-binding EF-hand superfamily protein